MKDIERRFFKDLTKRQRLFVKQLEKDLKSKGYVFAVGAMDIEGGLTISYFHKEDPVQELKWLTIGREMKLTEGFNAE